MTTELTQVQIEEIIKAGNEAKSRNEGKIPYGFNAELGKKYGRTSQSIGQIISGKRRSKKKTPPKNPPKVPEEKADKEDIFSNPSKHSYIIPKKFRLPNFEELQMFLQDHELDPVCNKVYKRMFVNRKDAGVYRDFYYVIEEMNKKNKYF